MSSFPDDQFPNETRNQREHRLEQLALAAEKTAQEFDNLLAEIEQRSRTQELLCKKHLSLGNPPFNAKPLMHLDNPTDLEVVAVEPGPLVKKLQSQVQPTFSSTSSNSRTQLPPDIRQLKTMIVSNPTGSSCIFENQNGSSENKIDMELDRLLEGLNFGKFRIPTERSIPRREIQPKLPDSETDGLLRIKQLQEELSKSLTTGITKHRVSTSTPSQPPVSQTCVTRMGNMPKTMSFSIAPWNARNGSSVTTNNIDNEKEEMTAEQKICESRSAIEVRPLHLGGLEIQRKEEVHMSNYPDCQVSAISDDCSEFSFATGAIDEIETSSTASSFIFSPLDHRHGEFGPIAATSSCIISSSASTASTEYSVQTPSCKTSKLHLFPTKGLISMVSNVEIVSPTSCSLWQSTQEYSDHRLSCSSSSAPDGSDSAYSTTGSVSMETFKEAPEHSEPPEKIPDFSPDVETSIPFIVKEEILRECGWRQQLVVPLDGPATEDGVQKGCTESDQERIGIKVSGEEPALTSGLILDGAHGSSKNVSANTEMSVTVSIWSSRVDSRGNLHQQDTYRSTKNLALQRDSDFRAHIVKELVDTEASYVESLQTLEQYYVKLKSNHELAERQHAERIFHRVADIKAHHEELLEIMRKRFDNWDREQKIGDALLGSLVRDTVIDCYTSFTNNWKSAKESLQISKATRPAFNRFLEQCSREHRGKLTLDALLIMPVQRIPRYELLIKKLLKHTNEDHPDWENLHSAQNAIHQLALKINAIKHEFDDAENMMIKLKELELYIDGLSDLVDANRKFIRFDTVTIRSAAGVKMDRCLFLFNDLLLIASLKRRSGAMRKYSSSSSCSPQLYPTLGNNKYKLLMRIPVEDLDLSSSCGSVPHLNGCHSRLQLDSDLTILTRIRELAGNLKVAHEQLDDTLHGLMSSLSWQAAEQDRLSISQDDSQCRLELTISRRNGPETIIFTFLSQSARQTWEKAFIDCKQSGGKSFGVENEPEFSVAVPIRKTRAGLQLTSAAATCETSGGSRDIWLSNSDTYIGQVCILSMQPEPTVTSCIAISNSRITCIVSVPPRHLDEGCSTMSRSISPISDRSSGAELHQPSSLDLELESEESSDEDELISNGDEQSRSLPSEKESFAFMSEDEMSLKSHNGGLDPTVGTMWIGMETGWVYVYCCSDNIRIRKPRIKLQHNAAVTAIAYTDEVVAIGLANGQVALYPRPFHGLGEPTPVTLNLSPSSIAVAQLVASGNKLYCAVSNSVHIVDLSSFLLEKTFCVDGDRPITHMAMFSSGVWIATQNGASLRLYSTATHQLLTEINCTNHVQKMLSNGSEIIRQHKLACLRVTALLAVKESLWVGTSAGVILTVSLPHRIGSVVCPEVIGVRNGHSGSVRFLAAAERDHHHTPSTSADRFRGHFRRGRRPSGIPPSVSKTLVMSGGDGYEDLRGVTHTAPFDVAGSVDSAAGRDDSTSHVLLWAV